ncbi:MAG: helicase-related protein, partial [Bradymonadaceae bacterium]
MVLDEFHERSVRADVSIAFLKELSRVREDLSLVVMSATIDAGPIADYLGVPSVESEGRTYPVDVEYLDQPSDDPMPELVARAVRDAIEAPDDDGGDILAFLPGAGSIERTVDRLEELSVTDGLDVRPLYGALPPEAQDRAIEPGDRRKIVVSTNIAETSLTIEGVTTVVDSGRVKRVVSDTGSGLERLEEGHVSLASAEQRAGRAGRTEPGRAYRLWTRAFEHRLDERETPELLRVDITGPVLEVIAWSGDDPRGFDWFEPPSERAIERAEELLAALGAIDREAHRVTELGRRILDLPVHPRIGRALVEAADRGCLRRVASMVAVLSERDFVLSVDRGAPEWGCDLQFRADVLDEVARGRTDGAASRGMEVHVGRARRVKQVRDQLAGLLDGGDGRAQNRDREARKALATGY